jgi:hypothetical protein
MLQIVSDNCTATRSALSRKDKSHPYEECATGAVQYSQLTCGEAIVQAPHRELAQLYLRILPMTSCDKVSMTYCRVRSRKGTLWREEVADVLI